MGTVKTMGNDCIFLQCFCQVPRKLRTEGRAGVHGPVVGKGARMSGACVTAEGCVNEWPWSALLAEVMLVSVACPRPMYDRRPY